MKVIFLFQLLLMVFIQNIDAENNWIIKGGLNYSELLKIESKPIISYSFGVERRINVWSFLSLNPEIL